MNGDQIFWLGVSGIIGISVVLSLPMLGYYWHAIVRDAKILELKLELVRQGFSAEDVERVVKADVTPQRQNTEMTVEQLKLALGEQGYSAEDIVQIVQATSPQAPGQRINNPLRQAV
jgi:hypothetical protein